MRPIIREKDKKYIEVIGHYDNPILCAKMTLLADLYAIEHKDGYALFDIKDYDKLSKIDSELEFSVTDLTGTTWLLNATLPDESPSGMWLPGTSDSSDYYSITFISNNTNYNQLSFHDNDANDYYDNNNIVYGETGVFNYNQQSWVNQAYRTITITGGTDATNANLIAWLQANAVMQKEPQESNKVFFGNSSISKIALGNTEVTKLFLGTIEIYSKATTTGYQVTVTNTYGTIGGTGVDIYDGQDSSGILLGTVARNETKTFIITSGYIYVNSLQLAFKSGQAGGQNPYPITESISLELVSGGGGGN